ncbi:MAG: replication factor C small subunit [Candidatus Micrarchaeota archaeon]|nr:replication factor C small subunit [Candidatus Micrarchaeota archaeon]
MVSIEDIAWTEKYRPSKIDEIIGQDAIAQRLKAFVKSKSFPNMIFAGPAGVGKTTSALAMAKELYGEDINVAFQELNASVTPETPILIRKNGKIERTTFQDIADEHFKDDKSKYAYPEGLEVLSINPDTFKVRFANVANISKHKVDRVLRIRFEGGTVRTSLNHSLVIMNEKGELKEIKASELRKNDMVLSFKALIEGADIELDVSSLAPNRIMEMDGNLGGLLNPKVKTVLSKITVDEKLAWLFGSYAAEGVTGFRNNTSGICVFTYGYPKEMPVVERASKIITGMGFDVHLHTIVSGSSQRESGVQLTVASTQLARFFRARFYNTNAASKTAHSKRIPSFIFDAPLSLREEFLKGYMGDAAGRWADYVRYCSVSPDLLTDVVWLAKISGMESSGFETEARLIWEKESSFYSISELLPMAPIVKELERIKPKLNWRYLLRHQIYWKKSDRISKKSLRDVIQKIEREGGKSKYLGKLNKLLNSDIYAARVKKIDIQDYSGYVYDVSVPGSEMFWGGTCPILLHNSDARGIDVIRGKVKEFARTLPLTSGLVKIVFLDEADALTPEAQHALRRTMERYSATTRFVFSANYASKIIEPIQSRCVVLRFKPLNEEEVKKYIRRIEKGEGLEIDEKAVEALVYVSEGDLRKLTNVLQSAAVLGPKITEREIYDIASRARPKEVTAMLKYALEGDFQKARHELDTLTLNYGMSGEDVLLQCYREALNLPVGDHLKLSLVKAIGEYNFRIVEGANERIQLEAMLANLALLEKK